MLIVALVLAVVGLSALIAAVLTGNELLAWICIAASAVGVLLLVADAAVSDGAVADGAVSDGAVSDDAVADGAVTEVLTAEESTEAESAAQEAEIAAEEAEIAAEEAEIAAEMAAEDHPEEVVHDEPDYDTFSDDEPDYPAAAEDAPGFLRRRLSDRPSLMTRPGRDR